MFRNLVTFCIRCVSLVCRMWSSKQVIQQSFLQRIQVECLMASVVAFVVTVELIAFRGKMTDVARRECQRSAWENHNMLFPRQNVVIPA